jgi:hypothetical protein
LGHAVLAVEVNPAKSESGVASFDIITRKPDDQVKVRLEKDTAVFDVLSRSGIGGATITRVGDKWPANVILRFHLAGLESLAVSSGKLRLAGSVLSHSGYAKRLILTGEGKDGKQDPGTKIEVLDAAGNPVAGLPDKGGYFQLAVPKTLLDGRSKTLELGWIDFFR